MTTTMMTASGGRRRASMSPRNKVKRRMAVLASAAIASAAMTFGIAAPASAATPVPSSGGPVAASLQGCKTMTGQPLLPVLCKNPAAPAYLPVPQSDGSVPWAALRGCVTNYRDVQSAMAALANIDPRARSAAIVIGATWCIYGLGSSGS